MNLKTFSSEQLDQAEVRFELCFPPDLRELLTNQGIENGYDWAGEPEPIRRALRWPFEGFLFDIEENGLWWPEWGERPDDVYARAAVLSEILHEAPRLIPLMGHRYLPEEPHEAGNPVFSVYQSDIIVFGADLADWIRVESDPNFNSQTRWPVRDIEFWSMTAERNRDPQFHTFRGDG